MGGLEENGSLKKGCSRLVVEMGMHSSTTLGRLESGEVGGEEGGGERETKSRMRAWGRREVTVRWGLGWGRGGEVERRTG